MSEGHWILWRTNRMSYVDADRVAADAAMAKLEAEAIEARRRRQLAVRTRRARLCRVAASTSTSTGLTSHASAASVRPLT